MKIQKIIGKTSAQFGESIGGEPYRLMACGVARAMGIQVDGVPFTEDETRWAGIEIQKHFIHARPRNHRKKLVPQWNKRYMQFKGLLDSIIGVPIAGATTVIIPKPLPTTGKFVSPPKKTFVPFMLFFVMSLYYALVTGPFYAAQSNPLRNVERLHMHVVSFDEFTGSPVIGKDVSGNDVTIPVIGDMFTQFVLNYEHTHDYVPDFQILPGTSTSPEELRENALDQEIWGTVYVNKGATTSLIAALEDGCTANPSASKAYDSRNVITIEWDEGRNAAVAGPNVAGTLRTLSTMFGFAYNQRLLTAMQQATVTDATTGATKPYFSSCVLEGYQALISRPVGFTEINLTPVSISPVISSTGILVGQIFVAVFGANFIVGATYANTVALVEDYSPYWKVGLRAGTMASLDLGLSIVFATFSK